MPPESFERLIRDRLNEGAELRREFAQAYGNRMREAASLVSECLRRGNKVLVVGNGGSAADAQHLAAELVGRFGQDRRPLPVIALTTTRRRSAGCFRSRARASTPGAAAHHLSERSAIVCSPSGST